MADVGISSHNSSPIKNVFGTGYISLVLSPASSQLGRELIYKKIAHFQRRSKAGITIMIEPSEQDIVHGKLASWGHLRMGVELRNLEALNGG